MWEQAQTKFCKELLESIFLLKSDPKQYASLVAGIQNDFISQTRQVSQDTQHSLQHDS
jgi:hypothetical protein